MSTTKSYIKKEKVKMNANEARKLTKLANTGCLPSIYKKIKKAANNRNCAVHVYITNPFIITELKNNGYKVEPFDGRWVDGAIISW